MPFNKEELNTILKFGAEELFKEVDDDDEVQVRNFTRKPEKNAPLVCDAFRVTRCF